MINENIEQQPLPDTTTNQSQPSETLSQVNPNTQTFEVPNDQFNSFHPQNQVIDLNNNNTVQVKPEDLVTANFNNPIELNQIPQQPPIDVMKQEKVDPVPVMPKYFPLEEDPVKESLIIEKQMIEYNYENDLSLQIQTPYHYYKVSNEDSKEIPVKISLLSKESKDLEKNLENRVSIDLICVVDVSGSMAGLKLELVKTTLKYILSILKENDRMAIIAFDTQGEVLVTLKQASEVNKPMFNDIIQSLHDKGGTAIHSGLKPALELIKNRKFKNEITGVFLLSDGADKQGEKIAFVNNLIDSLIYLKLFI